MSYSKSTSRWTKRRKIREEAAVFANEVIGNGGSEDSSNERDTHNYPCEENVSGYTQHPLPIAPASPAPCLPSLATNSDMSSISSDDEQVGREGNFECFFDIHLGGSRLDYSLSDDENVFHSNTEESVYSSEDDLKTPKDMIADLKDKYLLSCAAVEGIAEMLIKLGHNVPKTARAILGTSRERLINENFFHVGLEKGIKQILNNGGIEDGITTLVLQFGIDGIPVRQGQHFWPILCRVINARNSSPFCVSVYCGPSKPTCLSDFANPFIEEYLRIKESKLEFIARRLDISINSIVCDAQARSFCKRITSTCGYYACERCVQKGKIISRRMTLPKFNAPLRNDWSFRQLVNRKHHHKTELSPFMKLDIDMIFGFPLDYMHLVLLGVLKRLITQVWLGHLPHRLSFSQVYQINKLIVKFKKWLPSEIKRKGRPFNEACNWKANEFRTFLLYTGPIALKSVLSKDNYEHFLYLHVGIRILCSPSSTNDQKLFAGQCLTYFACEFGRLYGSHHLVYNVHSLSHLATDSLKLGHLDSFSAFPYENYLGKLKRFVDASRSNPSKTLASLKNRLSEIEECTRRHSNVTRDENQSILSFLSIKQGQNSVVMTKTGIVVRVSEVTSDEVIGIELNKYKKYGVFKNLYSVPICATDLNIFEVYDFGNAKRWPHAQFNDAVKCVILPHKNRCVVIPLLHYL